MLRKLFIFSLFAFAFLERTVWDLGPNVELVTTAMILASFLYSKSSIWGTLAVVVLSDLILGNSNIFLFTWTGFLVPALLLSRPRLMKRFSCSPKRRGLNKILFFGVGSNIFFFFWTNLGVWLLDSWGMYEKSAAGLIHCYINALPFLKNQLVSSLVFIPLFYLAYKAIQSVNLPRNSFSTLSARKIFIKD